MDRIPVHHRAHIREQSRDGRSLNCGCIDRVNKRHQIPLRKQGKCATAFHTPWRETHHSLRRVNSICLSQEPDRELILLRNMLRFHYALSTALFSAVVEADRTPTLFHTFFAAKHLLSSFLAAILLKVFCSYRYSIPLFIAISPKWNSASQQLAETYTDSFLGLVSTVTSLPPEISTL